MIKRRTFLGGAMAAAAASVSCRARRDARPNVVFILTDDQRWDCMSCAGHPFLKTPHIDRIAHEGARFSNAFCTTSLCSPSRASFLSGLYAHAHGVSNNFTDYPVDLPSYPRALQTAGYETAYIGKWHMGEQSDDQRPGFDYWASHKGQGTYNDTTFNINGRRQLLQGYYTHRITELAVDWLKRPRQKPFLLVMGHKAPHGIWIPEPKYEHTYDNVTINRPATANDTGNGKPSWVKERVPTWHGIDGPLYGTKDYTKFMRTYLETILSVDDSVGEVWETLRAAGELDNTVLLFATDNGFMIGEHGAIDKRCMYEESIRIPLLARYPALIRNPAVIPQMVLNVDFAPSVLDICGVAPPPRVHGRSWKPLVQGKTAGWRTSCYYEYNYEKEFPYTPNVRGVRTDEWKYVHYPSGERDKDQYAAELYNLKDDPLETRNLAAATPAKVAVLQNELKRLQQETGALPDQMPVNPEMKMELPAQNIR
jgi:N-acetylglucosamine-6-sulfatase